MSRREQRKSGYMGRKVVDRQEAILEMFSAAGDSRSEKQEREAVRTV
jgi:hypothetical protein